MTGKEDWEKKYREEIEEVNLRADMVCFRNDELENKLSKYERAFEIIKKYLNIELVYVDDGCEPTWFLDSNGGREIEQEEYELLEELMKSEI